MNIEIKNLEFGYTPGQRVINNIDLSIDNGNTLAIVGASGCGKSTLLRLIAGLITPNRENVYNGTITIDGETPEKFIKRSKTAFMFQKATLLDNMKVKENIAVPLIIKGIKDKAKVDEMNRMVELENDIHKLPKELSGGMQTRVALARTFISNPKLMLLDEPFSSLDIKRKMNLYIELEKLKKKSDTKIIFVTHDIDEALLISNHIVVFSLTGSIIEQVLIDKPLPRAIDKHSMKKSRRELIDEYEKIYDLIMDDEETNGKA